MKYLSLYIDKWYIVGTIIDDSGPHPLCLSNNEERIWLYFRNNVSANSVEYGKTFRESAYAGELNHYADVFKLIPGSEDKTFKLFGTNVEMRNIFDTAGIFNDLRNGFGDSEKIPTYVSFSIDIRLDAQSIFLELLKEKDFDVKEYVADIEHLALEYTVRKNRISETMYFLVANASNENLHYSLYHYAEGMFICDMHKTLPGNGEDLRSHALLEQVVENLNAETHFLQTEEEKEAEYRYLSKFTEDWLSLIDETPNGEPTPLGYINLRRQKGNAYHVSVMKDDVDKRTARIIDNVVREITRMIPL